jgi:CP family cyanate transporter-like MFS transporter
VENNNRYRFVIQTLVILIRGCVGLVWAAAGPLIPLLMQAFGISRGSAGWFASIAPITIAAVSLPLSIFLSRYSLKKTFAVGAFLQGAGLLTPVADSYALIMVTRILFAIGTAVTVPVASAILAEWFSSRKLPLINGVMMSFINLGNAIAFVATVPIATVLSWQAPITIYGAFGVTCATAWVIFGRDQKRRHTLSTETAGSPEIIDNRPDLSFRQVLKQRSTIMLALAVMGSWALGNAIGSWLPNYYHEVFHMPLEKASSILALTTVGGTAACIAGGILPMRMGRRRPFVILAGASIGLCAVTAVLFNNMAIIVISVALFGIMGNIQNPSLFTIPMELPNMSIRSGVIVISVMQSGGNLGNFIAPLIVGYIADITGSYLPGFFICAALSLSLLAAGLLLPETGPKGKTASQNNPQAT